jgi:hypothetical protein
MAKARSVQGSVKSITWKYKLNPANARKVQTAAVQSVAQYRSDLSKNNLIGREQHLQKLINKSARCTMGMFRTTPIGPLINEGTLTPAISVLKN